MPPTFHFPRALRSPEDQDDSLTRSKNAMSRLENSFRELESVVEQLSATRRAVASSQAVVGDQLITFATTENYLPLGNGLQKLARTIKVVADLEGGIASVDLVGLRDCVVYQANNAKSAKVRFSLLPFLSSLVP